MRLITIDKEWKMIIVNMPKMFQNDPVKAFDEITNMRWQTYFELADAEEILDRKLSFPNFKVSSSEFKLLVEDLNEFHEKARKVPKQSFYLTGDVDAKIIEACKQYRQHTRDGNYIDAYRTGLLNILEVMREDASYDEMQEYNDIEQNATIFHVLFLVASKIDEYDINVQE